VSSATEESIRCPACDEPMRETLLRGVPIDRCRNCRSVWLDGGELAAILGAGVRLPSARDDGWASGSAVRAARRRWSAGAPAARGGRGAAAAADRS